MFESRLRILDGHFLILICCKFYFTFNNGPTPASFSFIFGLDLIIGYEVVERRLGMA